jgi:eukaryotic-like serine/threonine-protein kinase
MPIVGDVLAGRYRIDAPIGVGGMASVYRAADLRLERDVAVKVLLPNLAADPALAQRFEREALALAATSHPSVVKVFDVEPGDLDTGREPFYVMELCDDGSLADRLRTRARLEPGEVVDVIGAVAAGLGDLHARGFVHRDVKPHNILFDHERALLADFGLARSEEASELSSLTASGATVGTLAYIAPELLRGAAATPVSDVYALGVVAFQALTGRLPRPATAVAELVESHGEPAPTVSSIVPELGTAFDAPIADALASDPTVRPAPVELAEALAAALSAAGRPAAAAAGVVPAVASAAIDPTDPDEATVTDVRPEWPADAPGQPAAERPGPPVGMLAVGIIGLALVALLALTSLLGDGGASADPSPPATAAASASPSAVATPSATPAPTPTPDPTPQPDAAAAAFAALDRVDAAIEDVADEDDVRKKDLDALRKRARDVRKAIEAANYGEASDQTARLAEEVDRVDDRVQGEAVEELKDAVSDLDEAIPTG